MEEQRVSVDVPERMDPELPELCRVFSQWLRGYFGERGVKYSDDIDWPEVQRISREYFNIEIARDGCFNVPAATKPVWRVRH